MIVLDKFLCTKTGHRFIYLVLLLSLGFFSSCFEYEEDIHFNPDFSGQVHIRYIVPLKNNNQESLIAFLPVQKDAIQHKINKGLFSHKLKIKSYQFEILEDRQLKAKILKKRKMARVSYQIPFKNLSELEVILPGNFLIQQKKKSISVKREFKSVARTIQRTSSAGEKRIHNKTLNLLGDGYMQFRVYFPQSFEATSGKGKTGLGYIDFHLPLIDTIKKQGIISWFYRIKNSN